MQLSGLSILLAEDDATNRLVTEQMLGSLGAEVRLARDGAEALELLGGDRFDVLLLDIEMPKVSGLEVVRRLRPDGTRTGVPAIIALTAHASREHKEKLTAAGVDCVITKPIVSIEQFGEAISSCLRRRAERLAADGGAAGADAPQLDMETYRGLVGAVGPGQLNELLGKVDADIASAYDRMKTGIAESDPEAVRAATHIMMAVAGAIGASGLQMLSQRLNRVAHEAPEGMAGLGAEAGAETERVLRFIRREMSS